MNELDKSRWKKVERLADKMAYVLEAVIRWRKEKEAIAQGMDFKIGRPRQIYQGPGKMDYIPLKKRK